MRDYVVVKGFYSGEFDKYLAENEKIKFDGQKAIFRGETVKAPQLMAAKKVGWIVEAKIDENGQEIKDVAPASVETPEQRAKRIKAERLQKVNGAKGNGEFLDEVVNRQATKVKKRVESPSQTAEAAAAEKVEATTKTASLNIVKETEGVEVKKVNLVEEHAVTEDETNNKSFYQALMDGERKKIPIDKDQFIPPKKEVIVLESQDEAVEVKRLLNNDAEISTTSNPLKEWPKMTAKKKETFIKKATDTVVIKQIINQETGTVKRKAVERLEELNERKGV